jgi:hypothetical protein
MLQELVDYRFASYSARRTQAVESKGSRQEEKLEPVTALPYFPNLQIACGSLRNGRVDAKELRRLPSKYGALDPARYFIARASGDSMDGGEAPIRNGDYLLLEHLSKIEASDVVDKVVAVERQDASGDAQYMLRMMKAENDGTYLLRANNPSYVEEPYAEGIKVRARLKALISPIDMELGRFLQREEIPPLFGEQFNPGNWNSGHVVLNDKHAHILLVTLNKQGKADEHRYHDYWVDEHTFHWQSQNKTTPASKKGLEIIEHAKRGIEIHLFVRETKLSAGKGAAFKYYGAVQYLSHTGSAPMSVLFRV